MSRKKAAAELTPGSIAPVVEIRCPACESVISSDGKKYVTRSARLEAYEKQDAILDKIEERLKKAEATITQLRVDKIALEEKLHVMAKERRTPESRPEPGAGERKPGRTWFGREES